jgi:hypothetical protein
VISGEGKSERTLRLRALINAIQDDETKPVTPTSTPDLEALDAEWDAIAADSEPPAAELSSGDVSASDPSGDFADESGLTDEEEDAAAETASPSPFAAAPAARKLSRKEKQKLKTAAAKERRKAKVQAAAEKQKTKQKKTSSGKQPVADRVSGETPAAGRSPGKKREPALAVAKAVAADEAPRVTAPAVGAGAAGRQLAILVAILACVLAAGYAWIHAHR